MYVVFFSAKTEIEGERQLIEKELGEKPLINQRRAR